MCVWFFSLLALSRVRQGACPESPDHTGSLSWVTISKAESHLSPSVRTWLVGNALQIQEATLSMEARPSLTKKASEGINHGLKRHCPNKACGGTLGLSDQLLRERGTWEGHQDKEKCTPPTSISPEPLAGYSWKSSGTWRARRPWVWILCPAIYRNVFHTSSWVLSPPNLPEWQQSKLIWGISSTN